MARSSLCWLRTGRRTWNNFIDIPETPRITGNSSWQLLQFYLQWRKSGDFQNLLGHISDWICDPETAIKTSWHVVGWKPVSNMCFGVRCGRRKCSGQGVLSVPNRPQRSKDEHSIDSLFHLQCLLCCWEMLGTWDFQSQAEANHFSPPYSLHRECPTEWNSQEVLNWPERFLRAETFSSTSELWIWVQKPEEAKLCLAIQSISFAFKCLTCFCTQGNNWSQKVQDKCRAEIYPGYISVKKGCDLRKKQNLQAQKRYGAMHTTGQEWT